MGQGEAFMSKTYFDDEIGSVKRSMLEARRRKRGLCPACGRPLKLSDLFSHSATWSCQSKTCAHVEIALRGSPLFKLARLNTKGA